MEAVLLYYKYVPLSNNKDEMIAWMQSNCVDLGLRGRVRVANDGINVTVRLHPHVPKF